MTREQAHLLSKAHESLGAAKLLASEGFSGIAGSRAYYTMFYAAQACQVEAREIWRYRG